MEEGRAISMTYNDKNYGENSVLRVRLPMKASELERIIRVHCEHHGVWDDCIVKSAETDRIRAEKAAKDEENARLREIVKELADVLDWCNGQADSIGAASLLPAGVPMISLTMIMAAMSKRCNKIVARAREVIGGEK